MSIWSIDAQTVTHSIQLAVAPVFFLTAVAGMIGSVAGRLARIIDRARKLEESLRTLDDHDLIARHLKELHFLRERGRLANVSIALLTLCGVGLMLRTGRPNPWFLGPLLVAIALAASATAPIFKAALPKP